MLRILYFILLLFIVFSCDKKKHVRKYSIPKVISEFPKEKNKTDSTKHLEFSWIAPDHWILGKESSMRIGSYQIPYENKIADLSITFFRGDGGGLLQNINRWRGQLNLEQASLTEINNLVYIGTSSIGEYRMYKIFNLEQPNRAFLCFIVSLDGSTLFLKLDCSIDGIEILENDMKGFMASFEYVNE